MVQVRLEEKASTRLRVENTGTFRRGQKDIFSSSCRFNRALVFADTMRSTRCVPPVRKKAGAMMVFLALILPVNAVHGYMTSKDVSRAGRESVLHAVGAEAGEASYNIFDKTSKFGSLGFESEAVDTGINQDCGQDPNIKPPKSDESMKPQSASRATTSVIHATIADMFEHACRTASVGILGETIETPETSDLRLPYAGTVLVHPCKDSEKDKASDRLTVRVATTDDDVDIANLRLSVFSDFTPEVRKSFCARSCHVLATRRNQGATCLVSTVPRYGSVLSPRPDIILGSVECSFHEFHGTALGQRRLQNSILYITEVAVSPTARRKGVGSKMMKALDELASIRGAETLYLHVEANNQAALNLYRSVGYMVVDNDDPMYQEFTRILQLHEEAPGGKKHFLMCKHLRTPTWLSVESTALDVTTGTLGFTVSQ